MIPAEDAGTEEGLAMILVTGATGNVGRPLVDLLVAAGAEVRAVTRSPATAGLPARADVVEGDPSRPDTMDAALRGVTGLFINARAVRDAAGDLVALAREHGARRVVALSAINIDDDPANQPSRYNGDRNKEAEDAAVGSGLEWVSLRPNFYATNTIGLWAGQIRAGDVVGGPYPTSTVAPIHEHDIADVAAHALLTDDLLGQRPVLTGPQSLTLAEMVAAIGNALGRPLRYQEIPPEVARQAMVAHGFAEPFVTALLALQAAAVGTPAVTTGEVDKILGRPARTFAEWATDHAADFQ
jgi:uncharacterized protein YbjT (DUF2867 family)